MSETHVEEPERLRLELNRVRAALEQKDAEIVILREGLCDIAKTAIKACNSTFEHMAVDTLDDANTLQFAGDNETKQTEPHVLDYCKHGISIFKPCEVCRQGAERNGAKADNSDRFFNMPETKEDCPTCKDQYAEIKNLSQHCPDCGRLLPEPTGQSK